MLFEFLYLQKFEYFSDVFSIAIKKGFSNMKQYGYRKSNKYFGMVKSPALLAKKKIKAFEQGLSTAFV